MLPAVAPLLAVLLFAQSGRHAPWKRNWRLLVPTGLDMHVNSLGPIIPSTVLWCSV